MDYKNHFKEKLSHLIFLEINKEFLEESLDIKGLTSLEEDLYLPLSPEYLAENITKEFVKNLPFSEFVKGMYYTLGADKDLNYNPTYIKILKSIKKDKAVKGLVAKLVKEGKKEEAIIYLIGLYEVHKEKEVMVNLLSLIEDQALTREMYLDALINYSEKAIDDGIVEGYLFKGSALRLKSAFSEAIFALREYKRLGGEVTKEISEEMEFLDRKSTILEAESILYENPKVFLEKILPILSLEEDNPRLLLEIGIAYRLLGLHEKAIYYLNDALAIDNAFTDVINELGINYASLGIYDKAIEYFRALFEDIRSIEILTNLITTYINSGDIESAKEHIKIAELMDEDDEILKEIKEFMKTLE